MKISIQKLILSLLWLALPMLAQAQFTYTTNNGAITITDYNTAAGLNVVIPTTINGYPVTAIGYAAFADLTLTTVTLPDSVTTIGDEAFAYCFNLTAVTIGNGVNSIGEEAFEYTPVTSVTIPNSVTNIGQSAFEYCDSLANVTIGNGVTFFGPQTFAYCFDLTNVTIANGVISIGDAMFTRTALTSVSIPNSVTNIGGAAFSFCTNLTSVIIPNNVAALGNNAYTGCTNLTSTYFQGNAPPDYGNTFIGPHGNDPATVYYLSGTTGWGPTFGGVPAVLWNPQAHASGFSGGQFGFNLTGPTNGVIVVEACTNLSNPVWLPVATNTFSASGTSTFSDPSTQPSRFYRFRSP
jgi:BspA type Leucine rich repeat region (6 copies)